MTPAMICSPKRNLPSEPLDLNTTRCQDELATNHVVTLCTHLLRQGRTTHSPHRRPQPGHHLRLRSGWQPRNRSGAVPDRNHLRPTQPGNLDHPITRPDVDGPENVQRPGSTRSRPPTPWPRHRGQVRRSQTPFGIRHCSRYSLRQRGDSSMTRLVTFSPPRSAPHTSHRNTYDALGRVTTRPPQRVPPKPADQHHQVHLRCGRQPGG